MITDFTGRMQQILIWLLREEGIVSIKSLGDRMHISKRTIQRELEYIEKPLAKYHIKFCSRAGIGVWLEGNEEDKKGLLSLLETSDGIDAGDKGQRRKRLTLEILKDKEVKKLYYYGELFGVSEATISSDLESLEEWLGLFGLKVLRKPGLGISIDGTESGFRQALRAFIDENINTEVIQEQYDTRQEEQLLSWVGDRGEKNIYRVLDIEIMKRVILCINRLGDRRILNLTENSYRGLVIHVTIAVNRIMKQEIIEENPSLLENLERNEEYNLAAEIVERLESEFEIEIPQVETAYIYLHIRGSKVQQIELDEASLTAVEEYRGLLETVYEMIDCYDPEQAYALKQDEEFVVQGLIAHLQPTLIRLANGMKIQNPLLEHIKTEYGEIYKRCEAVAKVLERRYGYPVPDAETGFLAIHFGAAMVRLNDRKASARKAEIGVVCASGIGISRLMMSKLNREFAERACFQAYGAYDLTPFILESVDFLITTVPIKEEIETLSVSPLLTSDDMVQIEQRIRYYERKPAKKRGENPFAIQLEQVNIMAALIKTIISDMEYLLVSPDMTMEEMLIAISEMLSPFHDRQWMIQEDIKRREQMGSQVFPEFGFALFHTKTGGVTKPSFSVCQAKGFVPFEHPYFHGISVIIVMLLPEDEHRKENREILGFLSGMLIEEPAFLSIISGGTKEEIRTILSDCLKRFFQQYLDRVS